MPQPQLTEVRLTPTMTPADFRAWRARHGWSQETAGLYLNRSKRQVINYEHDVFEVPPEIVRACRDIDRERGFEVTY